MDYETLIIIYIFSGITGGIISGLITGGIASAIGNSKGYDGHAFTLGFLLGILGIIIVACMPSKPDPEEISKQGAGWVCPKCHSINTQDSLFCKTCGNQKPRPVVAQPTQQAKLITPNVEMNGTFISNDNIAIVFSDKAFKCLENGKVTMKGRTYWSNDNILHLIGDNNQKLELSQVQNQMLVSSEGIVFKKIKKESGDNKMVEIAQNNTQKPEQPLKKITGTFVNNNKRIVLNGDSFKIYLNDKLVHEGIVVLSNDKICFTIPQNNKKMTMTLVNNNMLVSLGGEIFKKQM